MMTLILLLLISGYTFRVFFSYKELSSLSLEVLVRWNNLDRITNDILLRSAPRYGDLRSTIEGLQECWLREIQAFDNSLNDILSYSELETFVEMPEIHREKLYNLWNYTNGKLGKSKEDLENIIQSGLGERLVTNSFLDTFYQFRMLKVLSGDEIVTVIDFVDNLTVLDTAGEEITRLLLILNDEVQSSVDEKSRQAVFAALSLSLLLIIILALFIFSIRRVGIIEAQKQLLDRNFRLNMFKTLLTNNSESALTEYLEAPYNLLIFAPDKDENPEHEESWDSRMYLSEEYIGDWFSKKNIPGETVRYSDRRIYSIINIQNKSETDAPSRIELKTVLQDLQNHFKMVFSVAVSREPRG